MPLIAFDGIRSRAGQARELEGVTIPDPGQSVGVEAFRGAAEEDFQDAALAMPTGRLVGWALEILMRENHGNRVKKILDNQFNHITL